MSESEDYQTTTFFTHIRARPFSSSPKPYAAKAGAWCMPMAYRLCRARYRNAHSGLAPARCSGTQYLP